MFSHKLSQKLIEIGIELPKTDFVFAIEKAFPEEVILFYKYSHSFELLDIKFFDVYPALDLDSLLLLMPEIGEKMGWNENKVCPLCGEWECIEKCIFYQADFDELDVKPIKKYLYHAHRLLDIFLSHPSDPYGEAEKHLISLIERK